MIAREESSYTTFSSNYRSWNPSPKTPPPKAHEYSTFRKITSASHSVFSGILIACSIQGRRWLNYNPNSPSVRLPSATLLDYIIIVVGDVCSALIKALISEWMGYWMILDSASECEARRSARAAGLWGTLSVTPSSKSVGMSSGRRSFSKATASLCHSDGSS